MYYFKILEEIEKLEKKEKGPFGVTTDYLFLKLKKEKGTDWAIRKALNKLVKNGVLIKLKAYKTRKNASSFPLHVYVPKQVLLKPLENTLKIIDKLKLEKEHAVVCSKQNTKTDAYISGYLDALNKMREVIENEIKNFRSG